MDPSWRMAVVICPHLSRKKQNNSLSWRVDPYGIFEYGLTSIK
jgi:hypothetical protein